MKQNTLTADYFESTYALLIRSEEKGRDIFESVAYLVLILSAVFSIMYVARQPGLIEYGVTRHTSIVQPKDTLPQV